MNSVEIYDNIHAAVKRKSEDLGEEFLHTCGDRESIVSFLSRYFPRPEADRPWEEELMTRVPSILEDLLFSPPIEEEKEIPKGPADI